MLRNKERSLKALLLGLMLLASGCATMPEGLLPPSVARAAIVLSDLLARADARAGEMAAAFDRARLAGVACEQSYAALI